MTELYWGDDATAPFKSEVADGDLILARAGDGGTILLEWNATASQWEFGGTVNLANNDIDAVGDVEAASVSGGVADNNSISNLVGDGLEVSTNALRAALGDGVEFSAGAIQAALGDGLDFASGAIQILDTIWDGTDIVADVNNSQVTTEELTLNQKVIDALDSFNGGQSKVFVLGTSTGGDVDPSLGDRVWVSAFPSSNPGNDHGYTVDSQWWNDTAGGLRVTITETENAGGGQARIVGWRLSA